MNPANDLNALQLGCDTTTIDTERSSQDWNICVPEPQMATPVQGIGRSYGKKTTPRMMFSLLQLRTALIGQKEASGHPWVLDTPM